MKRTPAVACVAALILAACASDDGAQDSSDTSSEVTAESSGSSSTSDTAPETAAEDTAPETSAETTVDPSPGTTSETTPDTVAPERSESTIAEVTGDEGGSSGADELVVITSVDELPQPCIDVLRESLEAVDPVVKDIDWETATVAQLEAISEDIAAATEALDADVDTTECERYTLGEDDTGFGITIALAQRDVPGTVGWLMFLREINTPLSESALADLPTDCDGAIAYMDSVVEEGVTMREMQISDVTEIGQVLTTISTVCSPEQNAEFFARPDIAAFLGTE